MRVYVAPFSLTWRLALLGLAVCVSSASAQQRGRGGRQHPLWVAIDANRDGEISEAELANAPKVLKKLDRDGDGKLSMREYRSSAGFGGQGRSRPGRGGSGRGGPGRGGSTRLNGAGLKVGSLLPELTVYDETGKEFAVSSLKGKHTVLVFGCLT